MKPLRFSFLCLASLMLLLNWVVPLRAQTDRAIIRMYGAPKALLESKLAQILPEDMRGGGRRNREMGILLSAETMEGIVGLPESGEQFLEDAQSNKAPFRFYFRFTFAKKEPLEELKGIFTRRSQVVEKDGYTELRQMAEANFYMAFGDKWLVFASDDYEVEEDSLKRVTADLASWKKQKDALGAAAIDVKAGRKVFEELLALSPPNPASMAVKPLLKQVDFISLNIWPDGEKMAVMQSKSDSKESAEKFRESLSGLISLGKMAIERSNRREPMSDMGFAILEGMIPKQNGRNVEVVLEKPEGFDETMKEALAAARESARDVQRMNDVKQALLAAHNYHDVHRRFPFNPSEDDNPKLSWRVRVLPYIEKMPLYEMFDQNEAWNGPNNKRLLELQPEIYGVDESMVCWVQSDATTLATIPDGSSNTIALIVVPKAMNWSEPKDVTIEQALKVLKDLEEGEQMLVGMYDGSVRRISGDMDEAILKAMLTPSGGEVVQR